LGGGACGGLDNFVISVTKLYVASATTEKKNHISMWFLWAGICGIPGLEYVASQGCCVVLTQAQISFIALAFSIACTRLLTSSLP